MTPEEIIIIIPRWSGPGWDVCTKVLCAATTPPPAAICAFSFFRTYPFRLKVASAFCRWERHKNQIIVKVRFSVTATWRANVPCPENSHLDWPMPSFHVAVLTLSRIAISSMPKTMAKAREESFLSNILPHIFLYCSHLECMKQRGICCSKRNSAERRVCTMSPCGGKGSD